MRSIPNGAAKLSRAWLLAEGPAIAVFIGLALYAIDAAHYGIGFTDEGMKLSVPWRYTLGDVPFRDEIATVGRSFGIVLWPLFELLPDISVLELRYFSVGLQLAVMLSFYVLLRRFAPGFLVSLATLSSAFMARVGFWTPGYNILGVYFLLLAISLWLHACVAGSPRRQVLLALVAGATFTLAVVSYLTFGATLVFPAAVCAYHLVRGRMRTPVGVATACFLATALLLLAAGVVAVNGASLAGDWLSAMELLRTAPAYTTTFDAKLHGFFEDLGRWVPNIAGVAAILLGSGLALRREDETSWWRVVRALIPLLMVGLFLLVIRERNDPGHWVRVLQPNYHFSFCVMAAALGMTLVNLVTTYMVRPAVLEPEQRDKVGSDATGQWQFVQWMLVSTVLGACLIHGMTSGNGFFNFRHAIGPVFTVGIVGLSRSLFSIRAQRHTCSFQWAIPTISLSLVCAVYAALHLPERARMIYGDGPRHTLTATFSDPLLEGIHSTPQRVAAIEQLLEFFDGKLKRGEFLLEYGGAPILYYLTRTRPAAATIWWSPRTPEPIREALLRRMLRDGRIPRYSVRTTRENERRWRFSSSDVVSAYIVKNYSLVHRVHEFEIWERRPR